MTERLINDDPFATYRCAEHGVEPWINDDLTCVVCGKPLESIPLVEGYSDDGQANAR